MSDETAGAGVAAVAARVYADVVSPLVLGGALRTGRIVGGAVAVALAQHEGAVDLDLRSRTDLGRAQIARSLLAVDILPPAGRAEWMMFAALHDWIAAASPELPSMFSPKAGERALELARDTLAYVPPPANVYEALARHSFFARLFEVERKDVKVSFWAGSRTFLGTKPPERLLLWPEMRRVRTEVAARALVVLPEHGARVDATRWLELLDGFLRLTPLTDFANATREAPAFGWTPANLALGMTAHGRKLMLRAFAQQRLDRVMVVLGRATKLLTLAQSWRSANVAADVLGALMLRTAVESSVGEWSKIVADADRNKEMFFPLALGALVATTRGTDDLSRDDGARAMSRLLPFARSDEAKSLLTGAGATTR